ncbi:NAD(P)-binding protein/reductase, putative [Plasmodium knowlesi strain H]|uniref:NAD(P)-binding protein/reductase, putative n=3 Tax=Plasmodium knowlesi TaxID=5850 RepID=A0A5K1VSB5_PLAKH|nr:NAD(P)-binding protein, putative [Plasmodium knowlesi strain H]OTN68548.1 putative NAD(P)-binding protein/reductase [Plasmodium knowlesi]CAA9986504.1 NAD(P)-binding protein, putative [Plasmodium knowlesi strain H]SBO24236.1 NAD(P)-binding protein/reductase, putative [Plasmodium knowlesi strain H]SBO29751.1 NAD(P)-binding protein/reductase, putative [Plasmodium knowlesi strain H]VVS75978.1 NAD(P)-binding protein, putative [Plasmodium knowlesi strain H]|eukprot:XP_002261055.1 NAD(P)-binding protein/reductase, putative [Plasmodium knowlesi strain H]
MLYYVKKYIYIELLLILRVVNYYLPLDRCLNIAVIFYLTFLGLIYLAFKFRYRGGNGSGGVSWAFAGKHVCIVGGSEGLGLSLAKRIIRENPQTLTIMSRNATKLRTAKEVLLEELSTQKYHKNGLQINIIKCDIGMKESINEAFQNVRTSTSIDKEKDQWADQSMGSIQRRNHPLDCEQAKDQSLDDVDVLICNAAYICTEENSRLQMYDLLYTVNTNIYGHIDIISRVVKNMKRRRKGFILFVNSEGALYPVYGYSYYLMSKTCLWTYTYILDQELKYYNIHFSNAFLPSIQTPGYAQENLRKPFVTKRIEDLTTTVDSDYAADKVVGKMKEGKKFITLDFNGFMLSVLHSGYRNPESYFDYLVCVSFCGVFVFVSSLYKLYIEHIIRRNVFHKVDIVCPGGGYKTRFFSPSI